ncbi:hypothetical protein RUM43_012989, partial [Polyplax serrata]
MQRKNGKQIKDKIGNGSFRPFCELSDYFPFSWPIARAHPYERKKKYFCSANKRKRVYSEKVTSNRLNARE